jgi:hypothetical protein
MRQKLGVALAVLALAVSGAREASDQFRQLSSLAGDWAANNAWNSLLVYAVGTFDGIVPQRRAPLVASHSSESCDANVTVAKRRVAKPRRAARVKAEAAEPLVSELALGHAESAARRSEVEEFRIEIGRDAAQAAALVPQFGGALFETELAREGGRAAAEAKLATELQRLWGRDLVFKFTPDEAVRGRAAVRRIAPRRKAEQPREARTDADAEAQEILFDAPSDSGLLNCDEEPRR